MKSNDGLAAKGTTGIICSGYHYRQRLISRRKSSQLLSPVPREKVAELKMSFEGGKGRG